MLQCSFWSWIVTSPLHNVLHYGREILNILLAISTLWLREVFNSSFVLFLCALHCAFFLKLSFHVFWSNAFSKFNCLLAISSIQFLAAKDCGSGHGTQSICTHTPVVVWSDDTFNTRWPWSSMAPPKNGRHDDKLALIFHELEGPLREFSL